MVGLAWDIVKGTNGWGGGTKGGSGAILGGEGEGEGPAGEHIKHGARGSCFCLVLDLFPKERKRDKEEQKYGGESPVNPLVRHTPTIAGMVVATMAEVRPGPPERGEWGGGGSIRRESIGRMDHSAVVRVGEERDTET